MKAESANNFTPNPVNKAITRIEIIKSERNSGITAPIATDNTCMKTMAREENMIRNTLLNLFVRRISRMNVL